MFDIYWFLLFLLYSFYSGFEAPIFIDLLEIKNHIKLEGELVNLQLYKGKYSGQATILHEAGINLAMYGSTHGNIRNQGLVQEWRKVSPESELFDTVLKLPPHRIRNRFGECYVVPHLLHITTPVIQAENHFQQWHSGLQRKAYSKKQASPVKTEWDLLNFRH